MNSRSVWLVLLSAVAAAGLSFSRCLEPLEWPLYDLRFSLRPAQTVSKDIVIIDIDDDTLKGLGTWPLPRDFHASLVDALGSLGAKAVVFDLLFSEATAYDDVFAASMKKFGKVYLAQAFYLPGRETGKGLLREDHSLLAGITPALEASAFSAGHINAPVDLDGKTRRLPLFIRHEGLLVPQINVKAACDVLGLDPGRVDTRPGKTIIDRTFELPTAGENTLLVNYPGRWQEAFPHISYVALLRGVMQASQGQKPVIDLEGVKGKTCFVGLTAAGTSDLKSIPLQNTYPMLGLQASVFNSLVTRSFIHPSPSWVNAGLAAAVFMVIWGAGIWLAPLPLLAASAGLAFLYAASSTLLFFNGWLIDLFFPLCLIALTYVGIVLRKVLKEMRDRQLMEKELEIAQRIQKSFLPKDLLQMKGLSVVSFFRPAKFVAGDLYDIWKIDEYKAGILIGDVSGKGVSASLVMAETISVFRTLAAQGLECHELLKRLNRQLNGRIGGRFVTALLVIVDIQAKQLSASSAGHGPLLVRRAGQEPVIDIPLNGQPPLGLMDDVPYERVTFDLQEGDCLVMFSDGLPEARNEKGEEFGDARVLKLIGSSRVDVKDLLAVLQKDVEGFSAALPHDDITIVVAGLVSS